MQLPQWSIQAGACTSRNRLGTETVLHVRRMRVQPEEQPVSDTGRAELRRPLRNVQFIAAMRLCHRKQRHLSSRALQLCEWQLLRLRLQLHTEHFNQL